MPNSKLKRHSVRLASYDYTSPGAYFVTICTKDRKCLFGRILDSRVFLNDLGRIVADEWIKTTLVRPYVELDEYVIMPNHLHGLIILNCGLRRDTARRVPTKEEFGKPVPSSLPTVIRSFKSAVTKRINILRETAGGRGWQGVYFEHVVRSRADMESLRKYISENSLRWSLDKNEDQSMLSGCKD